MGSEVLMPFALRNVVSGVNLYTLYATSSQIAQANRNLRGSHSSSRYVAIEGDPLPAPCPTR